MAVASGLAGFAVGIVSPVLGSAVAGAGEVITGGLVLAPYSREQEYEADELGQALAARAGYDPAGLPRFLQMLDRDLALLPGRKRTFNFLDSHPLTPDRVARAEERARQLTRAAAKPIAGGRDAFLARLEGIVVGDDPARGVFEDNLFSCTRSSTSRSTSRPAGRRGIRTMPRTRSAQHRTRWWRSAWRRRGRALIRCSRRYPRSSAT